MVLFTMISRLRDSLPLAASMQNDEEYERSLVEYQQQAKMLLRRLNQQSPRQCSIESGNYLFHYLIDNDVVYLTLCDKNFSKRLSFSYLEDLAQEFTAQNGKKIQSVSRPYFFIEFDTYIQKARKNVMDSRSRRNLSSLNTELQDVQRIMVQNIDDVINRGAVLADMDLKLKIYQCFPKSIRKMQHI
ncbi:Vesicle-trafficking protein SEC22b-B [Orchesella cincta]|uniref:Vesicle-trafficking protein SEC22b-B n=1 Tax=Orchesella cincta TaxID=48709 RepID=A0A1D2N6W1_ORCCI|nr:Vesicle-trafficking protein SEC22b-B [Orchesella cincta]